jgi:hypothetical protein
MTNPKNHGAMTRSAMGSCRCTPDAYHAETARATRRAALRTPDMLEVSQ